MGIIHAGPRSGNQILTRRPLRNAVWGKGRPHAEAAEETRFGGREGPHAEAAEERGLAGGNLTLRLLRLGLYASPVKTGTAALSFSMHARFILDICDFLLILTLTTDTRLLDSLVLGLLPGGTASVPSDYSCA